MEKDYHTTTIRFPHELRARLKSQAALERGTLNGLVNDLCRTGLAKREETNHERLAHFRRIIRAAGQVK